MAQSLGIDTHQPVEQVEDLIFDVLYTEKTAPVAIPFPPTLLKTVKQSWKTPASMAPTSKRLEAMYRVQENDVSFLFANPKPNFIIVEASQGRSQKIHASPADKEGRRLDLFGRRVYSAAALGLRVAAYQATMARYQVLLWQKMASVCDSLPDDRRDLARAFHQEATRLSHLQLATTQHEADCAAKAMVSGVAIRRHAWLRSAGLSVESRSRIEDLPFDRVGLLNAETDSTMDTVQKAKATARKMGMAQPQQSSSFRQRRWSRFHQFQPRQTADRFQRPYQSQQQQSAGQQKQRKPFASSRYCYQQGKPDAASKRRL